MKYSDYKKQVEPNPEFREAREELQLAFTFADAVLDARLKKGWSQTELARRIGTRQANISRIEAGLANPTLELIEKICEALELKADFQNKTASFVGVLLSPQEYESLRQVRANLRMVNLSHELRESGVTPEELYQASRRKLEEGA
jgi:transcriptional regulator with XRE-family HTH domain